MWSPEDRINEMKMTVLPAKQARGSLTNSSVRCSTHKFVLANVRHSIFVGMCVHQRNILTKAWTTQTLIII